MNLEKGCNADSERGNREAAPGKESIADKASPKTVPAFRIVLIDDMVTLLRILGEGLKRYGHTVFTAASGPEGLKIFETHAVDVVVCDLGMPGMDGWAVAEIVQRLCKERRVPKVPFILLTGWGAEVVGSTTRLAEVGIDRVLEKPVEIPDLIEALGEVVRAGAGPEAVRRRS